MTEHTVFGTSMKVKSVFLRNVNIEGLIRAAETGTAKLRANGNYATTVEAGKIIGVNRETGAFTSTYTVFVDELRSLLAAFPGLP